MSDIISLDLLNANLVRAQGITVALGYDTNIGEHAFLFKEEPLTENEIPGIVIRRRKRRPADDYAKADGAKTDRVLEMEGEIIWKPGSVPYDFVEKAVADLERAIGLDQTWGGLAIVTHWTGDEIVIMRQLNGVPLEEVVASAFVTWDIKYRTTKWRSKVV